MRSNYLDVRRLLVEVCNIDGEQDLVRPLCPLAIWLLRHLILQNKPRHQLRSCRSSNTRRRMRLNSSTLYRTMHGQRGRDGRGSITCVAWPAAMMPKRCHHSRHAPVQISFVYGARTLQGRIEHAATQHSQLVCTWRQPAELHSIHPAPQALYSRALMSDISHTPARSVMRWGNASVVFFLFLGPN